MARALLKMDRMRPTDFGLSAVKAEMRPFALKEKTGLSEISQAYGPRLPRLIDGLKALAIDKEQASDGGVARNPDGGDWQ